MAKQSKFPKAASARAPRKLTQLSSISGSPPDATEDESDPSVADDELVEFLQTPPAAADSMHVTAASPNGDQIVQVRARKEVLSDPDGIASGITMACERWATSERRQVRFRAAWLRGERIVATHTFEHGKGDKDHPLLDGSAQSFLVQQQHAQLARDKLHLEGLEVMQEGWKSLLDIANRRNVALEKENEMLRERLRKLEDSGAEMQIEQQRAELEQRGRTADLLETRVLPLVQHLVLKQLEPAAGAVVPSKDQNSDNKQPGAKP